MCGRILKPRAMRGLFGCGERTRCGYSCGMSSWRRVALSGLATVCACAATLQAVRAVEVPGIKLQSARRASTNLEISGEVKGLRKGSVGYISWEELRTLPQIQAVVNDDPDLPGVTMRASGIPLDALGRALGAEPDADLLVAICSDGYYAYYPRDMVQAHRPLLVLTIDGMNPHDWAVKVKQDDPGPYLVLYDQFKPAWKVLAHEDKPQLPTNVTRLAYERQADTFARIVPHGATANQQSVNDGFQIARQNCIRCHAQGATGGTKSGKSWSVLGRDARDRPEWFARLVRNPKSLNPSATMPAAPEYDDKTLSTLTAYFRTFAEGR